jgi:hypothetical protein
MNKPYGKSTFWVYPYQSVREDPGFNTTANKVIKSSRGSPIEILEFVRIILTKLFVKGEMR